MWSVFLGKKITTPELRARERATEGVAPVRTVGTGAAGHGSRHRRLGHGRAGHLRAGAGVPGLVRAVLLRQLEVPVDGLAA